MAELKQKKTKQLIVIAVLLMIAAVVGSHFYDVSTAKKLAYVRVTNYQKYPDRNDVVCLAVILKSNPNKCFHILEFPPDKEAAKTLDNPAFNHTQYNFLFSLDPDKDDSRRRARVREHDGSHTTNGLADYSDLYQAISAGCKDEGLWEPTDSYYEIKDGEVYEKNSGERLIDYLSQDEKIPALSNNSQNISPNSNDTKEPKDSRDQIATETSHNFSSIPGCYALRFHKGEAAATILYLRKGGKAIYVIHENSSTDIKFLNGTYEVKGNDIFVVHEIGSFHVRKQADGSLRYADGTILEQDYSY